MSLKKHAFTKGVFFPTPANTARTEDQFKAHFWSLVDKSGECWIWIGAKSKDGYGRIKWRNKAYTANRLSFEWAFGPTKLLTLHRCDTPACVRPDHLFAGTDLDNVRDALLKGRRKGTPKHSLVCFRGHAMVGDNVIPRTDLDGLRCRACRSEYNRKYYQSKKLGLENEEKAQ